MPGCPWNTIIIIIIIIIYAAPWAPWHIKQIGMIRAQKFTRVKVLISGAIFPIIITIIVAVFVLDSRIFGAEPLCANPIWTTPNSSDDDAGADGAALGRGRCGGTFGATKSYQQYFKYVVKQQKHY